MLYPYDYTDFLQLHLNTEASGFDYDFDAHIAQCAHVFGPDEKGSFDDHCPPVPLLSDDDFGSVYSSSSSRGSSIIANVNKPGESDNEESDAPVPSMLAPLKEESERSSPIDSFDSFDGLLPTSQWSPKPPVAKRGPKAKITGSSLTSPNLEPLIPERDTGHKRLRTTIHPPSAFLSDEDADDESGDDIDDEYIPTLRPLGAKRRRTLHTRRSLAPTPSSSASFTLTKRTPGTSLSRNRQASSAIAINKACSKNNVNFICPECGWRQANKRLPDFKRHLRTHARPDDSDQTKGWWCKGILLDDAHKYNIPEGTKPYQFLGQERIGGCMQTFSRRDALKRHLDNANVVCVGWPCEAAEI